MASIIELYVFWKRPQKRASTLSLEIRRMGQSMIAKQSDVTRTPM